MKKITLSLFLLMAIVVQAQDSCATAVTVAAGSHTTGVIDGDAAPINCINFNNGSDGEWYKYTPSQNYELTISTSVIENVGKDTRFHVYSGSCGSLTCEGGDDDSGSGSTSTFSFNVDAGDDYYIVFDNRWDSTALTFVITEEEPMDPPGGDITFSNQSVSSLGSPYVIVDMNEDLLDDLVTVNNNTVRVNYQKADGSFDTVDVTTPNADNNPSWSIAAGDVDGNGYMDLLYGGGSGATFMLANVSDASNPSNSYASNYTEVSPSIYIFSQRTNFADINNDGLLDGFVCHDVDSNVYFINDGDLTDNGNESFETHQVGDGNSVDLGILGRNYSTLWLDYDNDRDVDVFISKCGGDTESTKNRMFRNNGDGTYTDVSVAANLDSTIQTWSSAIGDYDNDGDMDIMVGASSGSNEFMRNNGDGTFTDITAGSGFDTFNNTSIEYIAKDFNNDGYIDVLGSGVILINNGDMTFTPSASSVGSGAIGDIDNDGFLDVFNNGGVKVNNNQQGNYIKVKTTGTTSNRNGIGARVEITSALGTQIRDIRSGDGFRYMNSMTAHFGLGEDTVVESVTVYWPSGNVDQVDNPIINDILHIVEGSAPLSTNENLLSNVSIYPNPVENKLNINTREDLEGSLLTIFDVQGKKVYNNRFDSENIDVSYLGTGVYFLRIIQNTSEANFKFIKK